MEGNPELGGKGGVEEPEGNVKEILRTASKEKPPGEDSSIAAVKPARVSVEAVTHKSKADRDKNRGEMNWKSKADLLKGAAAGQVAEGVGKEG